MLDQLIPTVELDHRVTLEAGQTMAEYAVVLGVISAGLVLALTDLAKAIGEGLMSVVRLFT